MQQSTEDTQDVILQHYFVRGHLGPDPLKIVRKKLFNPDGTIPEQWQVQPDVLPPQERAILQIIMYPPGSILERLLEFDPMNLTGVPFLRNDTSNVQLPLVKEDTHIYVAETPGGAFIYTSGESMDEGQLEMVREFLIECRSAVGSPVSTPMGDYNDKLLERIRSGEYENYLVRDEVGNPERITFTVPSYIFYGRQSEESQSLSEQTVQDSKPSLESFAESTEGNYDTVRLSQDETSSASQPVEIATTYPTSNQSGHETVFTTTQAIVQQPPVYHSLVPYAVGSISLCLAIGVGYLLMRRPKNKKPRISIDPPEEKK